MAVAHAGLILGPLAGKILAHEMLEGAADAIPASFWPKRRMSLKLND